MTALHGWRKRLVEICVRRGLHRHVVNTRFKAWGMRGREDLYQVAAVALCNAATKYQVRHRNHQGKRTRFISYAWEGMWSSVLNHLKMMRAKKRDANLVVGFCEELHSRYYEVDHDVRIDCESFINRLPPRHAQILLENYEGYSRQEIADRRGVSKSRISQIIESAEHKLGIRGEMP